ncbi:MAG: hypothetical protein AB7G39_05335 [Alphaproteobacteria bacterium]
MSDEAADGRPRDWHEVIQPPTRLADKVSKTRGDPDAAMKRAERAVQVVAQEFGSHLGKELAVLAKLQARFRAERSEAALEAIRAVVHDLRGQGTTLGFPLVTEIGSSLCRYLAERDMAKPVSVELVERHVEALRVVYRDRIEGRGDELSRKVANGLRMAVDKLLS